MTVMVTNLLHKRRAFEVLLDVLLFAAAYAGAFLLRWDGALPATQAQVLERTLVVAIACKSLAFAITGVNRGLWQRPSLPDLHRLARAAALGSLFTVAALVLFFRTAEYARSILIMDMLLTAVLTGGARLSFRSLDLVRVRNGGRGRRVLVYGAGMAGELLVREFAMAPGRVLPIGFVDDDRAKRGRIVQGLPVLGAGDRLSECCCAMRCRWRIATVTSMPRGWSVGRAPATRAVSSCSASSARCARSRTWNGRSLRGWRASEPGADDIAMNERSQAVALLLTGSAAGLLVPAAADFVVAAGRNVPQPEMAGDYLRACFWALVIGVLLLYAPVRQGERAALSALWLVKCGLALGAMLFYEHHYRELDAFWYFRETLDRQFADQPIRFGWGTENVAVLADRVARLVGRSYHSLKLVFAAIGLAAVFLFYRAGVRLSGRDDPRLLVVLGLVPTVLFWSTILGKDPVVLLGIALYCWGVVGWQRTGRLRYLPAVAAGLLLAALIRLWLAPILLVPLAWLVIRAELRPGRRLLYGVLTAACLLFALAQFAAWFQLESARDLLETTNRISRAWAVGGSGQQLDVEFNSVGRAIAFLPVGMFTALFRPLPGEVWHAFGLLAGLENLGLLVLLGVAAVRFRRAHWRDPLVQWGFCWWQSGPPVRFRVVPEPGRRGSPKLQVLPVLVGLLLHIAGRQRPR
jgi:hypothetical protein